MKRLSPEDVNARKVAELGLDPSAFNLTSTEALAAALRRVAGFLCPCAPGTLVRAVVHPLEGLVADVNTLRDTVETALEAMVAHGDLLEQRDVAGEPERQRRMLIYAAPPSFVIRPSGAALLIGIAPDQLSALPEELGAHIKYANHIRRLSADATNDLRSELLQLGLLELPVNTWLNAPSRETSAQNLSRMDRLLDVAGASGDIPGLTILDPARPVRYYRGRWIETRSQSGRFVGRRNQAYGADLWCYVEVRDGHPERFIDLPLAGSRARGCDEAWRLQMAIDAERRDPQRFRLRLSPGGGRVVEFFSPVPMWARRRWDSVGELAGSSGCLFAYRFPESEVVEELRFVHDMLWLAELNEDLAR